MGKRREPSCMFTNEFGPGGFYSRTAVSIATDFQSGPGGQCKTRILFSSSSKHKKIFLVYRNTGIHKSKWITVHWLKDCTGRFVIEVYGDSDKVSADVVLLHSCPQTLMPNPVQGLLEVLWRHGRGLAHKGFWSWRSALWYSFLFWSLPVLRQWSFPLGLQSVQYDLQHDFARPCHNAYERLTFIGPLFIVLTMTFTLPATASTVWLFPGMSQKTKTKSK